MPFVDLPFIFRSFDLFVASLLFMKGISYCVIRRKLEPLDRARRQILRSHRSAWFPLLSACCFVEFDTSIICHVLVYCFGSFLWQDLLFKSPSICFEGTKYDIYRERVAYSHSILWRRARLWLQLFASTVGRFLSRVSYLPSYVFLRSFTSRKL